MRSDCDIIPGVVWDQTYLDANQVNHGAVNSLVAKDFLLDDDDRKRRSASVRYLLYCILAKNFPAATSAQKRSHPDGRVLPRYQVFRAPFGEVQYPMDKSELPPLPVLDLDEASISGTIKVLGTYPERLGLEYCVVGGKKIMFRGDFVTVRNITRAIYQSQMEIHLSYRPLRVHRTNRRRSPLADERFEAILGRYAREIEYLMRASRLP